MGWASRYIELLKAGNVVTFRPRGNSMAGLISSGQMCTVEPIPDHKKLKIDDIVLCRVRGAQYLHLIKAIKGDQYQIGNNRGHINGWISSNAIYGLLSDVTN